MNISASTSGMNAASSRMDNTARSVANVNTRDFAPQRQQQTETVSAPERAAPAKDTFESTAPAAREEQPRSADTGTEVRAAGKENADMARDTAETDNQRNTYTADARAADAQRETAGTVIDLRG
jgi:flagellar basal body rod protein FlgG